MVHEPSTIVAVASQNTILATVSCHVISYSSTANSFIFLLPN